MDFAHFKGYIAKDQIQTMSSLETDTVMET